mmetsp:Transcript_49552/g.149356  ORF Transcript_49552/g.149356 Transcript_49552/m.149356 type:complete len:222 (+) Transcript_49552:1573-2238(+)
MALRLKSITSARSSSSSPFSAAAAAVSSSSPPPTVRLNPAIFGPTPTLNSRTDMPSDRAARKCPNSCINTTNANTDTEPRGDSRADRAERMEGAEAAEAAAAGTASSAVAAEEVEAVGALVRRRGRWTPPAGTVFTDGEESGDRVRAALDDDGGWKASAVDGAVRARAAARSLALRDIITLSRRAGASGENWDVVVASHARWQGGGVFVERCVRDIDLCHI